MKVSQREGLAGDLWGGFASTLVAIPSALAFGVATFASLGPGFAGRGALAGLVAAVVAGFVAAPLSGAPRLITVPCAPAAAVMGALAAELAAQRGMEPERVVLMMALVGLACGVLQFAYGSVGAGRLIKYIPFPVVTGYLSGVGVIIFIKQLPGLCGVPDAHGIAEVFAASQSWRWQALVVGAAAMAGMLAGPRLTCAAPPAVLGLLGGAAAYFAVALFERGLLTQGGNRLIVGPLPALAGSGAAFAARWASAARLGVADLRALVSPALTLSVLLSLDTLKTCVVTDVLTRSRHDSDKELRAQGAANIAAALAGGVPVAGALGATLVNVSSGARTRLSGLFTGAFVLAAVLLLGRLVAWTPLAALSGILIVVAIRMVDWRAAHLLTHRSTVLDFLVMVSVVAVAVEVGLVTAAGVGLGLAILLFLRDQILGSVIREKRYGDELFSRKYRLPAQRQALERLGSRHVVCQLQGSLFFGTADQLFTEIEPDLKRCHVVILDLRRVQGMDFTAAHALEQIAAMLAEKGGKLVLAHLPESLPTGRDLGAYLAEVGLSQPEKGVQVFGTLGEALESVEDLWLVEEGLDAPRDGGPLALGEIDLLRDFGPEALAALAGCAEERAFRAGDRVFRLGDEGDELFLVRRGEARMELPLPGGRRHHLAAFGRGDFFGEVSFLDRGRRSADGFAAGDTDLYVLSRRRFDELSRRDPVFGAIVFARLARALALRLRGADMELRRLEET